MSECVGGWVVKVHRFGTRRCNQFGERGHHQFGSRSYHRFETLEFVFVVVLSGDV